MSDEKHRPGVPKDVVVPLFRVRQGTGVGLGNTPPKTSSRRRPARVAHMLATALRIEKMIERGELRDRADAAVHLGFTRARITQLLALTLLAPDIQEEILFLEVEEGVERITERALRPIAREDEWSVQRALWRKLRRSSES